MKILTNAPSTIFAHVKRQFLTTKKRPNSTKKKHWDEKNELTPGTEIIETGRYAKSAELDEKPEITGHI